MSWCDAPNNRPSTLRWGKEGALPVVAGGGGAGKGAFQLLGEGAWPSRLPVIPSERVL